MAQTEVATAVTKPLILRDDKRSESGIEPGCFITDWLNDPADADLSIARIRVEVGAATRLRRFQNICERYVVLQGQGRIELVGPNRSFTEGDHTISALEPGDVVMIPAGYSRRITNIGAGDLIFLAICTPRFRPAAQPDDTPVSS
ncbi:MAG: cupin domain-containing protein [Lautropia sp.]|nr:cupin domain-containing protein [Lautropia sp.]